VHARVAEDLAEQLAGTVDDAGLAGEVRRRGDEADDLDHAAYLPEVADLGLDGGDRVERALLRALLGLLGRHLAADLAGRQQLAVDASAAGRR
jgi:hypothetical protein